MFNVNIDISCLENILNFKDIQKVGEQAAAELTALTHAKVQELASQRLHTRLEKFREAVSISKEDGVHIIHLDDAASWIEQGYEAHSQIPDFMNSSKAKTAKDGSKYLVVPFGITPGKSGATQTSPPQQDLVKAVKSAMRKAKIPFKQIEKDDQGRPILGKLHDLKVTTPDKMSEGPGQGFGPTVHPRQGAGGTPFLHGAAVYQTLIPGGTVQRSIMTFRVAKESHAAEGRWQLPDLGGVFVMRDAAEWAGQELQENILPELIKMLTEKNG